MGFFLRRKKEIDPRQIVENLSEQIGRRNGPLEPLLTFVQSMPIYSDMLKHHQRTVSDLPGVYSQLRLHGAGQWSNRVYFPVAAIANPTTADFIFTILDRDDGWDDYNKWLYISSTLVEHLTGLKEGPLRGAYFDNGNP